jgi:signal transduction histidine kinase
MKTLARNSLLLAIFLVLSIHARSQMPPLDSLKRAAAIQTDTNKIKTLIILSEMIRFSQPDTALICAQQALTLAEHYHSDLYTFWSIAAMNSALFYLGNYTLQLDFAIRAIPLAQKLNNPYVLGYSNGMLSDSYYNLGEYETSLKYWRQVIKICEESLPAERFAVYPDAARIFTAMYQYDSSLSKLRTSYQLIQNEPRLSHAGYESNRYRGSLFVGFGNAFAGKGMVDSAAYYYHKSLPFSRDARMDINTVDAYVGLALVHKLGHQLDSAILYGKKALSERIARHYPQATLKATSLLADAYELDHHYDTSLTYLRMNITLRDSLYNRQKTIAFQNSLLKEKEKQSALTAAMEKIQRRYWTYSLTALSLLLISLAAMAIRIRRRRQIQEVCNRIADDLHDDIGSTLSSISIMSELAKAKSPDAITLLTSIEQSTNAVQENMSDIIWAIKSRNDYFQNVMLRMREFAYEILSPKSIELEFTNADLQATRKLNMAQRKSFYLFFKEVVNNAAKHSNAKNVQINIDQKQDFVEMHIRDDGDGFETSTVSGGNGMDTLKRRVAELKGDFKIISRTNCGTTVWLKFKIT